MNKFNTNKKYKTYSKVMRFGTDLFSPIIPPPLYISNAKTNATTTAINPQDIISTQNQTCNISKSPQSFFSNKDEIGLGFGAYTVTHNGYIEGVKSPYSKLGDVFLDVSSDDLFSINSGSSSNDSSSNNSICSTMESSLPPSSAIFQSELNSSSLDFFISNNSFIEEIKSSLSVEQQHYIINSSVTSLSPCMTPFTGNNFMIDTSYDPTQDSNLYNDIFDEEKSYNRLSYSSSQYQIACEEEEIAEEDIINKLEYHDQKLNITTCEQTIESDIKQEEDKSLNIKSSRKKRKRSNKNEEEETTQADNIKYDGHFTTFTYKKSRKNYNEDTINLLMDWYLQNNGKAPSNPTKKMLAEMTGKSEIQSKTKKGLFTATKRLTIIIQ
jgi:hypothetical protein